MSGITEGVKQFLKGSHQADSTEVCSEVAPEVTKEHIRPTEHTETAEAIDRERHIHHHQHRVQPIEDHRVLDTKHVTSTGPEVVREHKEEMLPEHQAKLHEQRTLHHDEQRIGETQRTAAHLGQHVNEHEHHHIHETIQPVIQRETVQPTVVHHTTGIHEKIHDAPIVHEATTLPTIKHEDFLKQKAEGGAMSHSDSGHHHQHYEGAPRVGGHKENIA
ncbi:hypothetical protein IAU60_003075 [Kwoniella sp. DSM 27419]